MNSNQHPAHIRVNPDGTESVQTVREHCLHAAQYASEELSAVGLGSAGFLAGVLHDAGKCTERFRRYIVDAAEGRPVVRGSVNHTFAGVRFVQTVLPRPEGISAGVYGPTRDLISYAIGAHHGQFDCVDENGRDGFDERIRREGIDYDEARDHFLTECMDRQELQSYLCDACREMEHVLNRWMPIIDRQNPSKAQNQINFYMGISARLLLSAVIDADRRDTAEFMQNMNWPARRTQMSAVWQAELAYAEGKITTLPNDSAVNRARRTISDLCRREADSESGLYRLNVPTGAGKSLSSLRFALAHAARWNKERIIFVTPLLGVLEQNAAVIRSHLSDASLVLEHHSNVVQPAEGEDELRASELYAEDWNAPVIITTLVQLLNTMFDGKTSCIRRFHSLCNAVVVIDEVQSVPSNLLTMFNLMISYLSAACSATFVLCSATQPYLEGTDYPIMLQPKELFPYDREVWNAFRRTNVTDAGSCRGDQLADRVLELAEGAGSLLVVCNKRSESERLFRELSGRYPCCHLSASMCMEHRRQVLSDLKRRLKEDREGPVFCVSTQVMETGVDISFERVIRLLAGMDSAVQAAGRCNREGEQEETGTVYILNYSDESLTMLPEIRRGKDAAMALLYSYQKSPERYRGDLTSEEAVRQYYRNFYREMPAQFQDGPIHGRRETLFSLLAGNREPLAAAAEAEPPHTLRQAFKEAGEAFDVYEENTIDVIVPYGRGRDLISDLCSAKGRMDPTYRRTLLQEAKGYTVTLYAWQEKELERRQAITRDEMLDIWYLSDGYYDPEVGVVMEGRTEGFMEV